MERGPLLSLVGSHLALDILGHYDESAEVQAPETTGPDNARSFTSINAIVYQRFLAGVLNSWWK